MADQTVDAMTSNFLQAAILSLRQNVVPALSDPSARIHADLVTRVLYMLHSRFSRRGGDLQQLIAQTQSQLDEAGKLLGLAPAAPAAQAVGGFSQIEQLEQALLALEMRLNGLMPQLIALAGGDSPLRPQAVALLRRVVQEQEQFLAAQDPDILKGGYVCYQGGRIEEERLVARPALYGAEVTEASLTQHLQGRFPGCRVEQLSVMAGGFSKTTLFFTLVHASGERESLVIRKDLPVDYIASVADEFPLLQKIHAAGFPVAEPRWLEDDPVPFGGRFMVSRRVGGSTDVSRWAADPSMVENFARQMAAVMGRLHALKLNQVGYGAEIASQSAGELMKAELERWHQVLLSERREGHPIEELAMNWLKANIPATLFARQGVLVHGDLGFHNLMIANGHVSALLDWEFSHPGDQVEDLVYTKPFIEKVMGWDTFKAYYAEHTGVTCTPEEEFFYEVWAKTRNTIGGVKGAALFATAVPTEIKFAVSGSILARYLGLEAGHMVLESLGTE
ncbi:MAG TPA: phosphotransferase family protein [Burkholderiaceae bacterium]|nr:phosphotransferase family protein [Burkholderiaceae bacterium]